MITSLPANLRDVRGLRTDDGRAVRHGALYRSEVPLSDTAGSGEVAVWPPADVIDLRVPGELPGPHALDVPGTTVHEMPMGRDLAPALAGDGSDSADHLGDAYRLLVRDAADAIARIAQVVASSPGPVLVHCTAGKDRTGIVVAVLLRAVGVRRADVLADYLRTEANLPRLWDVLRSAGVHEPRNRALMGVQAGALESVLDEVDAHDGGAAGWLTAHGVDADTLARLTRRLVGEARASAA